MKFKRYLFLVLILLVLIGISAASAADESTGDILSTHDNQEIILEESISEDALNDNNDEELILEENTDSSLDSADDEIPALNEGETTPGTFTDLQYLIDTSETGEITLSRNYTYNNDTDYARQQGIIINRTVSINGNGAVIDGSNNATIFIITANNVKINNITFQNAINYHLEGGEIVYSDGGAIVWTGTEGKGKNGILNNSNFINNRGNNGGAIKWDGANGKIYNSNFINNTATLSGGAIAWTGENGRIYNSDFNQNNATRNGGAIWWNAAKGMISNSNFNNNHAIGEEDGGSTISYGYGGATYWTGANGKIENSNFTQNNARYGGATYWNGADGNLNNSDFTQNNASLIGGAIHWAGANGNLNNSNFKNNTATEDGGAVSWYGADGNLNNSDFNQNNAQVKGGAVFWNGDNGNLKNSNFTQNNVSSEKDQYLFGGAIHWEGAYGKVDNSNFNNNNAKTGGAIRWQAAYGAVNNSNFTQNNAEEGGAIYWGAITNLNYPNNSGNVSNSNFINNTASNRGGAILWDEDRCTVNNSNFTQNNALLNGGAIYWRGHKGTVNNSNFNDNHVTTIGSTNGKGGAICWEGNDGVVDKSKFIGNNATNKGGAIYIGDQRNLKANNNIFLNNQDPINTDDALGHNIDYNWFGNVASNYTIKPIDDCNNWLFLNGTANPETMEVFSASEVKFKLFLYTPEGEEGNVTDYDNSLLPAIQLALSSTNGALDKESAGLDEVIKYTANTIGNGTITAKMDDVEETVALTVNKATTKITAPAVKTTYNIGKYLVITLKDSNGKALSGVKITVTFGKTRTYTTDKNGQVKINIAKYVPKTYNVKINFAGNDAYLNSTKSVKVVVQKAKPKITAKKKTFKRKTKVKKYSIVLKNNKKQALKKMRVTLKVKGKTFKARTNSKGKAVFKIKNLKRKGKYKAVIKFAGTKYYKKVTKTVRITVKK